MHAKKDSAENGKNTESAAFTKLAFIFSITQCEITNMNQVQEKLILYLKSFQSESDFDQIPHYLRLCVSRILAVQIKFSYSILF